MNATITRIERLKTVLVWGYTAAVPLTCLGLTLLYVSILCFVEHEHARAISAMIAAVSIIVLGISGMIWRACHFLREEISSAWREMNLLAECLEAFEQLEKSMGPRDKGGPRRTEICGPDKKVDVTAISERVRGFIKDPYPGD